MSKKIIASVEMGGLGFLPLRLGVSVVKSILALVAERNHPRQLLPFEKLQRRSASG
jgi:hypothetical protein